MKNIILYQTTSAFTENEGNSRYVSSIRPGVAYVSENSGVHFNNNTYFEVRFCTPTSGKDPGGEYEPISGTDTTKIFGNVLYFNELDTIAEGIMSNFDTYIFHSENYPVSEMENYSENFLSILFRKESDGMIVFDETINKRVVDLILYYSPPK